MYWPIGTPRIHATSSNRSPNLKFLVSNDGLKSPSESNPRSPPLGSASLQAPSSAIQDDGDLQVPPTPLTPGTPGIQPVEHGDEPPRLSDESAPAVDMPSIPVQDPILALRVSRAGHIFAVVTKTSITIWQTKVRLILMAIYALANHNISPR